jgi:hypothetical protein
MNLSTTQNPPTCFRRICIYLAVTFLSSGSSWANPISVPEPSVTPTIVLLVVVSILVEVACILLLLRRSRNPRFFVLWLIGMHLLTYPAFLGLLWLLQDLRPAFAVAIGEGLVVLIEGMLIYFICRIGPSTKPDATTPSGMKCFTASFAGNACSAVAFPILLAIHDRFVHP